MFEAILGIIGGVGTLIGIWAYIESKLKKKQKQSPSLPPKQSLSPETPVSLPTNQPLKPIQFNSSSKFKYDVFLSHNSKDKPSVRKLANRLKEDGLRVWYDEWEVLAGDDIYLKIEKGLEQSQVLVLFMSPNAFGSDWVELERSTALFRDPGNKKRRFVPLLLKDCEIPDTIRRYKYIDWREKSEEKYREILGTFLVNKSNVIQPVTLTTPPVVPKYKTIKQKPTYIVSKTNSILEVAIEKLRKEGVTVQEVTRTGQDEKNPENRETIVENVPIQMKHVRGHSVQEDGKTRVVTIDGKKYTV